MAKVDRAVPTTRLGRLARLASAGLRASTSLGEREVTAAAEHAAEVLGTLRGLASKVGQMASYVDGVVPEAQRGPYETAMKGLLAATPASNPAEVRHLVEDELGAPLDRLFLTFDVTPFASASIGQVHRAVIATGDGEREVAVKVQHPGIARALHADLANASLLQPMFGSLIGRRFKMKEQLEVVRQRFTEELDYGLEAERLSMFAGFHEGDQEIRLPRVHPQRTARRVLTTDLMHGATFDEACRAPESDRRRWAETLWRFVFKGNLVHGHFNADPHPGNYLFCPAGTVVFLDFGCVQPIEAANLHCARALHRAAMALDERAFADAVIRLLAAPPGALQRKAIGFMRRCFEPLFHRPYRMTRAYVSSIVDELRSLAADARRADDVEFFALPADMLFMNRLQFGFYSVLARLDVEVDYSAIERRFWPEVEAL